MIIHDQPNQRLQFCISTPKCTYLFGIPISQLRMAAKVQKLHFESRFSHFAHQQVSSLNAALCCGVVWYRHGRAFCKTPLLLPPPPHLRYEQHGRGDEQEQEPVGGAKGRDTEHAAAEADDDDLTSENERGNQQETAGGGNMREGGAVGAKARALNMFQSWSNTKSVKKRLSS